MEFGLNFFPDVGPDDKSAKTYFEESLELANLADNLGYDHLRIVEHYFHKYGGYSPNPLIFLAAAAQRTVRIKLITGAVLPVFNHPLKLAGEIGMVDALSGGRLEIGFARAFLPHEFQRFGRNLDESRGRFDEGLEIVTKLLESQTVAYEGEFHSFPATTSLPRPTTLPRPPIWVACLSTPDSFIRAGELGHSVMAIPLAGGQIRELLECYRGAYKAAGHPGEGRVMLAFHMYCAASLGQAMDECRGPINRYLSSLADAASGWIHGTSSTAYPGYDTIIQKLRKSDFESQVAAGVIWVGDPASITAQIHSYVERVGPFDVASLQVNFNTLPFEQARRSVSMFAAEVIPKVRDLC